MNEQLALKLQAYLDGELSRRERAQVERVLAEDDEARALLGELRMTVEMVRGNELERPVPVSREFYWQRIEQGIREAMAHRPAVVWEDVWAGAVGWLRRHAVPLSAAALLALVALLGRQFWAPSPSPSNGQEIAVIESLTEEMGSYTFEVESEKMFVVWLYERTPSFTTQRRTDAVYDDDVIPQ